MMRKLLLTKFIILALPFSLQCQTKLIAESKALVFTHVNVVDATGGPVMADVAVAIVGDRIASINKTAQFRIPEGARVIDATGKFLIPGLWDMHVHWYDERFLPLFIANGVTGVRQMFGRQLHLDWRRATESGELLAPRQFIGSPILEGKNPIWPSSVRVSNQEEGRQAVRQMKAAGYDFIKVYQTLSRAAYFAIADEAKKQGISFGGHLPYYVTALEASEAGQKHIEHLDNLLLSCSAVETELRQEMKRLADAGGTGTDSGDIASDWRRFDMKTLGTYDHKKAATLFERFAKNKTWQCPTLAVNRAVSHFNDTSFRQDPRLRYVTKSMIANWQPENDFRFHSYTQEDWELAKRNYQKGVEMVGEMRRAGVGILAGTDAGNPFCFPGFSLHDELALLVEAGLTPMEALQAGTLNAAIYMDKSESLGTIERGKLADLVLLDANPLEDIRNTQRIAAVVVGGKLLDKVQLEGMMASAERTANLKSIREALMQTIEKQDVESAIRQYRELKSTRSHEYDFGERELNGLGYSLLSSKRVKEAIEIFKLNVEAYPESANVYDSLGEGYMTEGDNKRAIHSFKKSLELDPQNDNALQMLKKLSEK